ncbi:RNA polymerase sigma factor [Salibacterium qingdaonense]|uniref:RNA polymerase sigma factor n=1 Tax=Salibacterium qingdaonense TaxID=266892 RepID=A0A1I4LMG7_9BACI|nr:RNA polymerase sigma factor [Salibacterium qingdaonense]SFL92023.1 RNA polymerase, sigma subunit, SigY [Salibacterium qingdaonense]
MTVEESLELARSGSKEAFHDVVHAYYQTVQRFAYQIGVQPDEIDDVTQEVFLKVYRSLGSFSGGTFTTWLYSITLNTARDMMRKQKRQRRKVERVKETTPDHAYETLQVSEEAMELHDLIQGLDEKYRVPLVLHYFHHQTYAEISEVTGTSESGVKSQVMRARKKLKAAMEKEGESDE